MKGLIAGVFVLGALILGYRFVMQKVISGTKEANTCLALVGSTTTYDNGSTYIVGSVKSDCSRTFSSVTVTFKLDSSGNDFGHDRLVFAYGRNIAPGETLEIRTNTPVPFGATYRLDSIHAF